MLQQAITNVLEIKKKEVLSQEIENIKKNQVEILRTEKCDWKKLMDELGSRTERMEKTISELEDKIIKITQSEQQSK